MYVAVKGGEKAIANAHQLLADYCRGDTSIPAVEVNQIAEQFPFAVSRVMSEGSLYDPTLAALAYKQAGGDITEAIFLVRAFRTTLPRYGYGAALDTSQMMLSRRVSAVYKDLPGGQMLGPTFDYTHRLLNFDLASPDNREPNSDAPEQTSELKSTTRVSDLLRQEDLLVPLAKTDATPVDLSLEPLEYPAVRSTWLQALSRGDEGFLMSLAYSTQRGYSRNHPFAGEIRIGFIELEYFVEELGFALTLGEIQISECDMINQFTGSKSAPPQFTQGYGLCLGYNERKVMAMSLVDRALRAEEFDEDIDSPAQSQEFVLSHCDALDASGFVSHLKLPHYVDFQSELTLIRSLRAQHLEKSEGSDDKS